MEQNRLWGFLVVLASVTGLPACAGATQSEEEPSIGGQLEPQSTMVEDFESSSKTTYAAGNVTFASGTWNLDDALVGTLESDVRAGTRATRIRNSGTLTMGFDRANAGTVTIKHATYGTDANGSWGLFYSRDQGATWTQVGDPVTTVPDTLATASFAVDQSGSVRLQVRKLDGGANRIDVDDVSIADYAGGGGGGGGGSRGEGASVSVHTTLGLPSAASTSNSNDYLSVKSQYVIAYNSSRKIANWASWELNTSYLGTVDRSNNFRIDDTLPSGMAQATNNDYSGSGYDRGHLCPSGDRTKTTAGNGITFYLTNMLPQAPNNNRGPWEKLESYSRTLAKSGKELFTVMGGIVTGSSKTIGDGVVVPDSTFKVVAVLDRVGAGPEDVTTSTRIIAIVVPNDDAKVDMSDDWKSFRVSARSIEDATNLNFLSDVPQSVQDTIETRVDSQ